MKILYIQCGLGNQMFQYAFYKYLLKQGVGKIYIDATAPDMRRHQGFELKKIFPIIAKNNAFLPYLPARLFYLVVGDVLKKVFHINLMTEESVIPPNKIWLKGYWQEYRYADSVREELLHDFTFIPIADEQNKTVLEHIRQSNSVSIHIRRGDYVIVGINTCLIDYYERAIVYIKERVSNPHFFVFSDDPQWVIENLKIDNATYVSWNRGNKSFRDMQLMSECRHTIIANSSFSWWGAWLNQNPSKIVIAPSIWIHDFPADFSTKLIPPTWVQL